MNVRQLQLFRAGTEERKVVSRPLIMSPGEVVDLTLHVRVWPDEGRMQLAYTAESALTHELFEWSMDPLVTDRADMSEALDNAWSKFQVLFEDHTAPF